MPHAKIIRGFIVLGALALVFAALPALAFSPENNVNDRYEVRLPQVDMQAMTYAGISAGKSAETVLQSRYGGSWQIHAWNARTGTPRWFYGSAVRKAGAITSERQLETLARQVVAENFDLLRAEDDDLKLTAAPHAMNKWAAHLQQYWNGYPVHQALVRVVFHENGNLMIVGSDYDPNIALDPRPALSAGAAADAARGDLPFNSATDSYVVDSELMVLPVLLSDTEVEHHLVYRVTVSTAAPLGEWITHVDAHDGTVVWRYNNVHFDFEGDATHEIQPHTYCNPAEVTSAPHMDLNVNGVGSTTTDVNGQWSVAGGGATATVTAALSGPWVTVYNYRGAEGEFSGTATAGEPFTVAWDDGNARQDERDVFDAVNRVHDFFERFDPGFGYSNQHINAYINRADGYCPGNAWWDGTINFCEGSATYGNTGEIQQVVEHEFGHGVQDYILGTQGSEGLGEGNSDILGNLITQDHVIGKGFYVGNCVSGIRDVLNTLQYPQDLNGSVHHDGQIISGFNWDAMVLLQSMYGMDEGTIKSAERWHFGRVLMHPYNQPDQVLATFIADDDNGDLDDGTPHHAIFAEAAENHNYDVPEILVGMFVYHDGAPYQTNPNGIYDIKCTGASLGGGEVDPSSFELLYSVDGGGYITVPMTANGDEFQGSIPGQAYGSLVEYYISASNSNGDVGTSPRAYPESNHLIEVNDFFDHQMEMDTAWRGHLGTDTASTGAWERADPTATNYNGITVQLGDDHSPAPGVNCWVTGATGSTAGANDVDGGKTTLLSPMFDLTGGFNIEISYWRYYTNSAGGAPNLDYWKVDISNDGGTSWSSVENTLQSDTDWQQIVITLSDFFTEPGLVQLRFIADDAGDGSLVEAMVDDFVLVGEFSDVTGVEDGVDGAPAIKLTFDLGQNHPNPFNPSTKVAFSLDRNGPASLRVFDTRGRLVRTLVNESLAAGAHTVTWHGDDNQGRSVASGVYFYRLETDDKVASKRMLLVK